MSCSNRGGKWAGREEIANHQSPILQSPIEVFGRMKMALASGSLHLWRPSF
jgi:hypothetical protein